MKKLSILLLIIFFVGCAFPDYSLLSVDIPEEFSDYHEAWMWVAHNINYDYNSHPRNWPHPEKVYRERKGDCKGYSLLLAHFLDQLGYTVNIVVYRPSWFNGPANYYHAIVYIQEYDLFLEPQIYGYYEPRWAMSRVQFLNYENILLNSFR